MAGYNSLSQFVCNQYESETGLPPCHMACPSRRARFRWKYNRCWRVQIMTLLVISTFSFRGYSPSLIPNPPTPRYKYRPQNSVLKHSQYQKLIYALKSMVLQQHEWKSHIKIKNLSKKRNAPVMTLWARAPERNTCYHLCWVFKSYWIVSDDSKSSMLTFNCTARRAELNLYRTKANSPP